jgi:hypothetical protein
MAGSRGTCQLDCWPERFHEDQPCTLRKHQPCDALGFSGLLTDIFTDICLVRRIDAVAVHNGIRVCSSGGKVLISHRLPELNLCAGLLLWD